MRPVRAGSYLVAAAVSLTLLAILVYFTECSSLGENLGQPSQRQVPCITLQGHNHWVHAVAFSPDGALLASGGGRLEYGGECKLWDVARGQERANLAGHKAVVRHLAFSPDGQTLVTGSVDNTVVFWDAAMGLQRSTLPRQPGWGKLLALSPDGQTVAVQISDSVTWWDVAARRELAALRGYRPLAFSPTGKTLATMDPDGPDVRFWDVTTGQKQGALDKDHGGISPPAAAFAPDGQTLATSREDWTVKFWDVATGRERMRLAGHRDTVNCMAFSPDGRTLATGSTDRTIKLWEVATGREQVILSGHTGAVYCLAFSPDGKRLASGGYDKTVRLWDVSQVLSDPAP